MIDFDAITADMLAREEALTAEAPEEERDEAEEDERIDAFIASERARADAIAEQGCLDAARDAGMWCEDPYIDGEGGE